MIEEIIQAIAERVAIELKKDPLNDFGSIKELIEKKEQELLTVEEASIYYKRHKNSIRHYCKTGELASVRIGGKLLIIKQN
jgi:hypothetical protein